MPATIFILCAQLFLRNNPLMYGIAQKRNARAFILAAERCAGRSARKTSEAIKMILGSILLVISALALLPGGNYEY
jgi:hypothetical protein